MSGCNTAPKQDNQVDPVVWDIDLDKVIAFDELPLDSIDLISSKVRDIKEKVNRSEDKWLDYMFLPGGAVEGSFDNGNLVWCRTFYGGEFAGVGLDFFLENDTPILAFQYWDEYRFEDELNRVGQTRVRVVEKTIYFKNGVEYYSEMENTIDGGEVGENRFDNVTRVLEDIETIKNELVKNGVQKSEK